MAKLRLFLALVPPVDWREQLARTQEALRDAVQRELRRSIKWVAPENVHLTLIFFGEVEEGAASRINDAAQKVALGAEPFDLRLGENGFFQSPRGVRVIWSGIEDSSHLQLLQRNLGREFRHHQLLSDSGKNSHQFSPHLTLARIKTELLDKRDARALADSLKERMAELPRNSCGVWRVNSMELIRSELLPSGPRYSALSEIEL